MNSTIMKQFTLEKRWILYGMLYNRKLKLKEISKKLWFSTRTIRRELDRWNLNWSYAPIKAQKHVDKWRSNNARARTKLLQNNWYLEEIKRKLDPWAITPDSLAWRKKEEGKQFICTKTIYNYIWLYDWWLKKKLTYKKKYKKHKSRQWKRPEWYRHISTRNKEAEDRLTIWHMEIDLVLSKWNKAWLMTLVDRKSRYGLIIHVKSKHSASINEALIEMISKKWLQKKLKTITSDNWREFFGLRHIEEALWFEQYFADPYCSWQRWTNEQYNGQIRKFLPKWTDFNLVAIKTIKKIQIKLNRKPRKILWYLTPEEVFLGQTI